MAGETLVSLSCESSMCLCFGEQAELVLAAGFLFFIVFVVILLLLCLLGLLSPHFVLSLIFFLSMVSLSEFWSSSSSSSSCSLSSSGVWNKLANRFRCPTAPTPSRLKCFRSEPHLCQAQENQNWCN